MEQKRSLALFYGSLCVVFWGMIPVVSKLMLRELNNFQILFYSALLSTVTLFLIVVFTKKLYLFKQYSYKDYGIMGSLGFLGSYLYYVLLYGAFSLTTAQEGFILAYLWPILVVLLSIVLLKEKFTFVKIASIVLSFIGVFIIFTNGHVFTFRFTNVIGNALAFIGAFVFASFSVLGKKYKYDRVFSVFIFWLFGLVFITINMILFYTFAPFSFGVLLLILLNGIIINGMTYIFWFKSLELADTAQVANLLYLSPFLSLIYIFFFLHEKILLSSIVGLIFIMGGIVSQSMIRIKR